MNQTNKKQKQITSKPEPEKPVVMLIRKCLMCYNNFKAHGRFNRICAKCKESHAYKVGD